MSLNKVIKLMGDIKKHAQKYSQATNPFYKEKMDELGEEIRDRLLTGLTRRFDIDGNQFKHLKKSTIAIRGARDINRTSPLRADGGIEEFLQSSNLFKAGSSQVRLNSPTEEYMIHQNEGFVPKYIPVIAKRGKKRGQVVYIENKKGISVPARKWFGIPKGYREGGPAYNKFMAKIAEEIEERFGDISK